MVGNRHQLLRDQTVRKVRPSLRSDRTASYTSPTQSQRGLERLHSVQNGIQCRTALRAVVQLPKHNPRLEGTECRATLEMTADAAMLESRLRPQRLALFQVASNSRVPFHNAHSRKPD